jgi:hypothetical protein
MRIITGIIISGIIAFSLPYGPAQAASLSPPKPETTKPGGIKCENSEQKRCLNNDGKITCRYTCEKNEKEQK